MTQTTVLVVSPSSASRARISKLLGDVPDVQIIAEANDLSETFHLAESRAPDLVVVSDDYRTSNEFTAMKSLFYALETRWIFVNTSGRSLQPPPVPGPAGRSIPEPILELSMAPAVVRSQISLALSITRNLTKQTPSTRQKAPQTAYDRLVVIGSSTGGVDALLTILSEFPEDCPPTAIVQHTGKGFSESLIRLLERRCKPQVVAAQDGLTLRQGMVCVAAGTPGHMVLQSGAPLRCQIRAGAPISGHVPSVDGLFRSVLPIAPQVVAVILTGMGQDGAAGMLDLRRAGSVTIGQDEATSVVYGMPRAAWEMGAVQQRLPVHKIAAEILKASVAPAAQGSGLANRMVAR